MEGVHTALVTPFAQGAVDIAAWELLLDRQVEAGVDGVVVCGTTGESPTVNAAERAELLAHALSRAALYVTMGVGTNNTATTVANCEAARLAGAHAGLLVLPYYNKPTQAGLLAHVRAAAAVGLPLVVYHVPGRTAQRLSPDALAQLCEVPGVISCKEATGDLLYLQDFLARSPVPVLSGDDFTWLPALSVGARGVISVLSNVAPALTVQVWRAWERGEARKAASLHARLYPVVHYLFGETNPGPAKAMLAAMELCRDEVRLPLVPAAPPPADLLDGLA